MEYGEFPPPLPLADLVVCYWRLRHAGPAVLQTIIPDGCPEIVIHRNSAALDVDGATQAPILVHGQLVQAYEVYLQSSTDTLGIRLQPWALGELIDCPARDLTGANCRLVNLAPQLERDLHQAASGPEPTPRLWSLISDVLLARRRSAKSLERRWRNHLAIAIQRANATAGNLDAMRAGWPGSIRQFERMTSQHIGLTPRQLAGILRFRVAYGLIRAGHPPQQAALRTGYYDLSHLHKDARRLAALPPAELAAGQPLGPAAAGGAAPASG